MADGQGPWDRPPALTAPPAKPARRWPRRGLVWIAVVALCGLGLWGLWRLFPGRISTPRDWSYVAYDAGWIVLVLSSLMARRLQLKEAVRYGLIWTCVAATLGVGYVYRDTLVAVGARVRSALIPSYAVAAGPHELVLNRDQDGAFYAIGKVDGQPVTFLVDTGASDIVLSPQDAQRLGIDLKTLSFSDSFETANGVGRGARYRVDRLQLGSLGLSDVPVSINQAPMRTSLLGMAFFKKLDSFAVEGDRLRLKWRDPV